MKEENLDKDFCLDFDELIEDSSLFRNSSKTNNYQEKKFSYLAKSIKNFLYNGSKKNTLIGITGQWGSGKSSFCKYLENTLCSDSVNRTVTNTDKYSICRFCFFDLWKHQNDPIKKTVLMALTSFLLEHNLIDTKESKYAVIRDKLDFWMKKVRVGLIKNSRNTILKPILSIPFVLIIGIAFFRFFIDFTNVIQICKSFFNTISLNISKEFLNISFLGLSLIISLALIFLLNVFTNCFYNKKKIGLFSLFVSKEHDDFIEETGNKDLTAEDFRNWINTILLNLKENTCIILVLDNLDRLPESIVKDFLASVQEIFLELDPYNSDSRLHIIVPFDYSHIKNVFQYEDKNALEQEEKFQDLKTKKFNFGHNKLELDNDSITNDILNKTFSCIFYLPHTDSNDIRNFFDKKLSGILSKCRELKMFSESSDEYSDEYLINCCWNIFSEKYTYGKRTFRNMLSFLRELAVIIQINAHNFNPQNFCVFVLYAAFYCANISVFRSNSFASCMSILDAQWKNELFGFFTGDDFENKQEHLFYQYMACIYYQAPSSEVSGELYYDLLLDAFEKNNIALVKDCIKNNYFSKYPDVVISVILSHKNTDIERVATILEEVLKENYLDSNYCYDICKKVFNTFVKYLMSTFYTSSVKYGGICVGRLFSRLLNSSLNKDITSLKKFYEYSVLIVKNSHIRENQYLFSPFYIYLNIMLGLADNYVVCDTILKNTEADNSHIFNVSKELSIQFGDNSLIKTYCFSLTLEEINSFLISLISNDKALAESYISKFTINPLFNSNYDKLFEFIEQYPVFYITRSFFKELKITLYITPKELITLYVKSSLRKLYSIKTSFSEKDRFLYFSNCIYKYFLLCSVFGEKENCSYKDLCIEFKGTASNIKENTNWTPFVNFICLRFSSFLTEQCDVSEKISSILKKYSVQYIRDVTSGYENKNTNSLFEKHSSNDYSDNLRRNTLFDFKSNKIPPETNLELSSALKSIVIIYSFIKDDRNFSHIELKDDYKDYIESNIKSVFRGENNELSKLISKLD